MEIRYTAHLSQSDIYGIDKMIDEKCWRMAFCSCEGVSGIRRIREKVIRHIYRNQISIQTEVMDYTLSVSPTFFDFYPALKVDFALEEIFHIISCFG